MTDTLFKEVHYSLGGLIGDIALGRIGLPDIQCPFVWANAKVRDLFDSMYRGYPVGYFLFWQTGAEGVDTKVIGDANNQKAPLLLIVDGQQRLTSLYAVIRREAVLRENFEREHFALVEWDENIAISDAPPAQYWGRYAERFDHETQGRMMEWHALPPQWWTVTYEQFLAARRPLIASVIRQGYQKLVGTAA